MSLAWTTIAFVVLLLPGVLFFVGIYIPEQFTRDTAPKSPLGQLAGAVVVSLGVHGTYFVLQGWTCALPFWPCVNLEYVLATLQAGRPGAVPLEALAANITQYRFSILLYFIGTAAAGLWAGKWVGSQVVDGRLRWLAQHEWVLDLPVKTELGYTYAYVLTHIQHEGKRVLYRGVLDTFGIEATGRFSYVVIKEPRRSYLRLEEESPRVDVAPHLIGAAAVDSDERKGRKSASYFAIEGEDIANVVFDRYDLYASKENREELTRMLKELNEKTPSEVLNRHFPRMAEFEREQRRRREIQAQGQGYNSYAEMIRKRKRQ